jgi:solute carrier family 25 phosphate transporter 23/24/25/41
MSSFRRLVCGGAAGITSVFFTYPLDIVRTRLSIQSASFAALGDAPRTKLPGMWATITIMYKTEGGILALYRGIIPTVAGVAPYVCVLALHKQSLILIVLLRLASTS